MLVDEKIAALGVEVAPLPDLRTRLRHACRSWAGDGYDLVQANPNAKDLFDLAFLIRQRFGQIRYAVSRESFVACPMECPRMTRNFLTSFPFRNRL